MKRYMIIFLCVSIIVALLLFCVVIVVNRMVVTSTEDKIVSLDRLDSVDKTYSAIVVLGAGLQKDGSPSHMLEDRLKGAISLYRKGASEIIVLSGDNSGESYDEVTAMERYCLQAGIPSEAILRDEVGFSTYDTVYNTVKKLGYDNIIFVTQEYHLYRALYLADKMGADADGLASDPRTYSGQIVRDIREYLARTKDFFKINLGLQ